MIYNSFEETGLLRVLRFLKIHNTEYLSGQDLSDVLRISRVAVWKHIKKIQALGYTVESKQKEGYKLTKNSDLLLPWEIISGLETKVIGQRTYYFDSIDSTQNQALKMAKEEENNGTVIIAEKQTGGRGRSGRKWVSPKGGIWFSIILGSSNFADTMVTTSPTRECWNNHWALAVLMPTHPWLTLATPCEATDQGAAWMNSPEFVMRNA